MYSWSGPPIIRTGSQLTICAGAVARFLLTGSVHLWQHGVTYPQGFVKGERGSEKCGYTCDRWV